MHDIQKKLIKLAKQEDIGAYGYRKLGAKIGVDHPQKVKWHLQKLVKDGKLLRAGDGSYKVADDSQTFNFANVPILGMANCGEPLSFADNTHHGYLSLSPSILRRAKHKDALFAVQATGDSMNACNVHGQNIDDGDYVIVDSSVSVPQSGDYVVSSVDGMANIKRYRRSEEQQLIALQSESTRPRPPIIVATEDAANLQIHGTVVDVIKTGSF